MVEIRITTDDQLHGRLQALSSAQHSLSLSHSPSELAIYQYLVWSLFVVVPWINERHTDFVQLSSTTVILALSYLLNRLQSN